MPPADPVAAMTRSGQARRSTTCSVLPRFTARPLAPVGVDQRGSGRGHHVVHVAEAAHLAGRCRTRSAARRLRPCRTKRGMTIP